LTGKLKAAVMPRLTTMLMPSLKRRTKTRRTLKKLLTSLPNILLQRTSPPVDILTEVRRCMMRRRRSTTHSWRRKEICKSYTWVERARAVDVVILGMEYGQSNGYSRREEQTYLVRIWLAMQRIISGLDGGLAEMQRGH
jgi:hypothetical protein